MRSDQNLISKDPFGCFVMTNSNRDGNSNELDLVS
jgi:hypothetical protein